MSDRYETPSWDDEPDDRRRREAPCGRPGRPGARARGRRADLDASSENVLDGWPAIDPNAAPAATPAERCTRPAADAAPPPTQRRRRGDGGRSSRARRPDRGPGAARRSRLATRVEHAPGELTVPPGYSVLEGIPSGERRAVGIVVSRFNGDVTTRLLESALDELEARGVPRDSVTVMPVPGAFELPLAAMALAKTRRFACIVALGCVIRGDTPHFDYVSSEAASGLQLAAIETGVPVAFGVLTLDRADQAESRVGKGAEAVLTASRWPTCSRTCVPRAAQVAVALSLHSPAACPRSAHSAGRSPASETTGATRWSPPSAASTRTSSGSG